MGDLSCCRSHSSIALLSYVYPSAAMTGCLSPSCRSMHVLCTLAHCGSCASRINNAMLCKLQHACMAKLNLSSHKSHVKHHCTLHCYMIQVLPGRAEVSSACCQSRSNAAACMHAWSNTLISTHLSQWTHQQAVQMDPLNPVVAALFWLTALCAFNTGLPCLQ